MKIVKDGPQARSLNCPSMFFLPIEKSSSIYSVMEFIDKLLIGPLKKPESEIKSYQIRFHPSPPVARCQRLKTSQL